MSVVKFIKILSLNHMNMSYDNKSQVPFQTVIIQNPLLLKKIKIFILNLNNAIKHVSEH